MNQNIIDFMSVVAGQWKFEHRPKLVPGLDSWGQRVYKQLLQGVNVYKLSISGTSTTLKMFVC